MRKYLFALAAVMMVSAMPVFAQGPFTDVPPDHWAYDAVNLLQREGYIIGYPDGTFGGKRAITRYEFAVAIARIVANMTPPTTPPVTPPEQPTTTAPPPVSPPPDLSEYVKRGELPDFSKFANKADVDALRKLMDEFRDELAALGVDVDALKRDIAALDQRVTALEAAMRRVKITGSANVFGIANAYKSGVLPFDRDERPIPPGSTYGRNLSVVTDFELGIVGRISQATTANATINYGNYLNYLAFVDDYVGGVYGPPPGVPGAPASGVRPTTTGGRTAFVGGNTTVRNSLSDVFFPFYLYIDTGLCRGELSVGRFPIQFTPYTLRRIDVDSYTSILKTDDGNYPMDGIKLRYGIGGVDLTLFAAKNDTNDFLLHGLTGQPTAGIFDQNDVVAGGGPFHALGGHSVGGLVENIAQTAGGRLMFGIPWGGNLGFTFYQAWSETAFFTPAPYDQAQVYGVDLNVPFTRNFLLSATWNQCNTLAASGFGVANIDGNNQAWDGRISFGLGKLGLTGGYKQIDRNYAAAGSWDKIGRWTNPTNVKGPYGGLNYPITSKVNFMVNGEFLTVMNTVPTNLRLAANDNISYIQGGLRWGISRTNSVALGYEWVDYSPNAGGDNAYETYLTIGWAQQLGSAGMQIGYQFIDYNGGSGATFAYGPDNYRAGLGVVQFGVSF